MPERRTDVDTVRRGDGTVFLVDDAPDRVARETLVEVCRGAKVAGRRRVGERPDRHPRLLGDGTGTRQGNERNACERDRGAAREPQIAARPEFDAVNGFGRDAVRRVEERDERAADEQRPAGGAVAQ